MTDVDRQVARAGEVLDRTRAARALQRGRRRAASGIAKRVGYAAAADLAILVVAVTLGWYIPIGMGGVLLAIALMAVVTATLLFASLTPPVRAEHLTAVPLKALPLKTEQWLETQRALLPGPVQTLVDGIGVRLEALAPQLATLDEQQPAATEVRKLIGEQLPELIRDYGKVPADLRTVERNGRTPDAQLADGLRLIDEEISQMSAQLAQGDLDLLETRGRFLEIKYRD